MSITIQPDIETVFIKMEDDDENDTENFVCNFCYISFVSSQERDLHLETHLIRQNCSGCNKSMILIGNQLYELHLPAKCEKSPYRDDKILTKTKAKRKKKERNQVQSLTDDNSMGFKCIVIEPESESIVLDDINSPSAIDSFTANQSLTSNQMKSVDDSVHNQSNDQSAIKEPKKRVQAKQYKRHPKTIPCDKCDEMFGVEQSLIIHQRKVHNIIPIHKCDICGLILKTAVYLKNHMAIHSDTKRYICNYCGKGFHLPYNLKEHIHQHTGEKPYKCDVCDKRFGRQTLKAAHMRVHTGEKPFKCTYENCDRAYSHLIDLKRHRRTAHGIILKTFECPICLKIFYENKFLTKHLNVHKEKS